LKKRTKKLLSERPLIFLHIPKCSGIAVSQALLQAEQPKNVFFGFDKAFFGSFNDFESVGPENKAFIHLSPNTIPRNETFVRAHMSLSTLRTAFPHGRFMTVLREPICRILSHYAFWRASPDEGWGSWTSRSRLARGPLETFLDSPEIACQIDNVATRLLLWPHPLIPDAAMINFAHDARLRREATARLRSLDFADAIENPSFYPNLSTWIATPLTPTRVNETPLMPPALRTPLDRELTPRALTLLAARSRLDLHLWQSLLPPHLHPTALRAAALLQATARTTRLLAANG
jgi:hypothetical protein